MCTPLALAGLALGAAGTGMQMASQKKSQKAMDAATSAEASRQAGFQREREQQFGNTLKDFDPEVQRRMLDSAVQERQRVFADDIKNTPLYEPPVGGDVPKVLEKELGTRLQEATRYNSQQGNALARLGGYSPFAMNNAITLGRGAQQQNMLGNFSAGSQSVLPLELSVAARKGERLGNAGQLTSALGTMLALGGAMGGGPGWGGLFGKTPKSLSSIPIKTF